MIHAIGDKAVTNALESIADLTIFNQDLFYVPKDQWPDIEIEMTIINGEILYAKSGI